MVSKLTLKLLIVFVVITYILLLVDYIKLNINKYSQKHFIIVYLSNHKVVLKDLKKSCDEDVKSIALEYRSHYYAYRCFDHKLSS